GVAHVLIGHSDRRYVVGESDEVINKKIKAAIRADVAPILLVGERSREDDKGKVLEQQLSVDLAGLSKEEISKVLIAYEPVWAISTSDNAEADTPKKTLEAVRMIKKIISEKFQLDYGPVLYGGSVNENNVVDFLKHEDVGGGVIGGASLRKEEFMHILKIVSEI
ncbi:MAG: triose-phosphate isomerase, partial [Candidatus Paceibacterota bacterium]